MDAELKPYCKLNQLRWFNAETILLKHHFGRYPLPLMSSTYSHYILQTRYNQISV